jgi:hypothetical protein
MRNRLLGLSVILCAALVSGSANAVLVDLTFSGIYDVNETSDLPFSYSITYDTSLDTNTEFFASGSSVGGMTALNDFYGYSASGITSALWGDWDPSEIVDRVLPGGSSAALWFDADIAVAAPTLMWVFLDDGSGYSEQLGGLMGNASGIFLKSVASFDDIPLSNYGWASSLTIASSVPEPGTGLLMALGLGFLGAYRRR